MPLPSIRSRSMLTVGAVGLALGAATLSPTATAQVTPGDDGASAAPAVTATAAERQSDRRTVFYDDFSGGSLNSRKWTKYDGGDRRAENAFVRNGNLVLRTQNSGGHWTAAGVTSAKALKRTYGRYTIRAKFERGWGIRAVALLWPAGGGWPPEVDFYEISANDPGRRQNIFTNHYQPGNQMEHREVHRNFTRWHRVAVWWKPGKLVWRIDGRNVGAIHSHIPHQDMWLGLQTAAGGTEAGPNGSTPRRVDFVIDWVKVTVQR